MTATSDNTSFFDPPIENYRFVYGGGEQGFKIRKGHSSQTGSYIVSDAQSMISKGVVRDPEVFNSNDRMSDYYNYAKNGAGLMIEASSGQLVGGDSERSSSIPFTLESEDRKKKKRDTN